MIFKRSEQVRPKLYVTLLFLITMTQNHPGYSADLRFSSVSTPILDRANLGPDGGNMFQSLNIDDQSGDLVARTINADGTYSYDAFDERGQMIAFNGNWRASITLTNQSKRANGNATDNRTIITSGADDTGRMVGRMFIWNHLENGLTYDNGSGAEDLKIQVDPGTRIVHRGNPDYQDPIVNWIRGYDTDEKTGPGGLRIRNTVLGRTGRATPQYLGSPSALYDNKTYESFRRSLSDREPMIYLPAGDGMLHGIRGNDGWEVFAFIPHEMLDQLVRTSHPNFTGVSIFDSTPRINDARGDFPTCLVPPCWQTILAGGTGPSGRSVYALNVTDPGTMMAGEAPNASPSSSIFLWEFTDPDLGITRGRPIIEQLGDGTWVAVFGSGQTNETEQPSLFVVNIATGQLIEKLATGSQFTSGLSSPVAWDSDFDNDIDYVYAGDLSGNLWRFDFTRAGRTGGAEVSFAGLPLISVTDAESGSGYSLTSAPLLSLDPQGGVRVLFGSSAIPHSGANQHAVFGVLDRGYAMGKDPPLVSRSLIGPTSAPGQDDDQTLVRLGDVEKAVIDPVGWRIGLPEGNGVVGDPVLNDGRLSFTADSQTGQDNESWFVSVSFNSGSAPGFPLLNLAGNRKNDEELPKSTVGLVIGDNTVSGPSSTGSTSGPDIVIFGHGDSGNIDIVRMQAKRGYTGRVSWREVLH